MENDISTLLAVLGIGISNIAITTSLFLWLRSEANNDRRSIHEAQRNDRQEFLQLNRSIEKTINCIQLEIKDFHCKIYDLKNKG